MDSPSSLGRFIKEVRTSLGYTSRKVEELSRTRPGLTPISHSNLLAIEKGAHVPTYDKVLTLSHIFNVPTGRFEEHLRKDMLGSLEPVAAEPAEELLRAGLAASEEGDSRRALELLTQAHVVARERSPELTPERLESLLAETMLQAANCRARLGLLRVAREDVEELLSWKQLPPLMEARANALLAEIYRELGNHRLALLHCRAALAGAEGSDDAAFRGKIHNSMGNILDDRGDTEEAIRCYRKALETFEALGDRRAVALVARNLGTAYYRLSDTESAIRYLEEGIAAARELGDRRGLCYGHANLARAYYLKDALARAKDHARQAKQIAQREGFEDALFTGLYYLWRITLSEGQQPLARIYADRLGTLHRKLEARTVEAEEWANFLASSRSDRK